MIFNSPEFVFFFLGVLLVTYIIPLSFRYVFLSIVSLLFYSFFGLKMLAVVLALVLISFLFGLVLGCKKNKILLFVFISAVVVVLFIFKYTNFGIKIINKAFRFFNIDKTIPTVSFFAPIGLSYITFQIISYFVDVYKSKISAQKNFIKYFLYITFFTKIIAGPIERAGDFFNQLDNKSKFNIRNIQSGMLCMLYGFFMKMVVADRASIFVNSVFSDFENQKGVVLIVSIILYSIQIYADFAGYSLIAFGASKTLGLDIDKNFCMPYFSKSVSEFWKRWHISLSSWLKDYIYIPLGGSRKGSFRTNVNLMATFLVSGLWHGAEFNYVVWGGGAWNISDSFSRHSLC